MNGRKTRSLSKGLFSTKCKCTDHDIVSVILCLPTAIIKRLELVN